MQDFDELNSVLSEEDLDQNTQFIYDLAEKIASEKSGLAGSHGENAVSRDLRDAVLAKTGEFAHIEAFGVNRLLGKGAFLILGIIYSLSLVLYFISFSGNNATQITLSFFAMLLLMGGIALFFAMLCCKINDKQNLTTAYNVVSEKTSSKITNNDEIKTVIIAANHSGNYGGFSLAYGVLHKVALIYMPISYLLFIVFCIVKMAVGTGSVASIVTLTVLPFITSILGIIATVTRYSVFNKRAIKNNGIASAIALDTYAYFVETPELIPENTRLVFASFGGESCNQSGSKSFISAHPEYKDAKVVVLDNIISSDMQINKRGTRRGSAVSLKMEEVVTKAASLQGISIAPNNKDKFEEQIDKFYGTTSDSFHNREIPCVCISSAAKEDSITSIAESDINKVLSLCVGTIINCFQEIKKA